MKNKQKNEILVNLRQVTNCKNNTELADLLRVDYGTFNTWLYKTRNPSSAALRLFEVLTTVAIVQPSIIESLKSRE